MTHSNIYGARLPLSMLVNAEKSTSQMFRGFKFRDIDGRKCFNFSSNTPLGGIAELCHEHKDAAGPVHISEDRNTAMFDKYPYLKNDKIIIRKMTPEDAVRLKKLTEEAAVYKTVPTFLYELKYPDKEEVIRRMDEECFATRESILMGVFLTEEPDVMVGIAEIYNYEENKKKASIGARIDERYFGRGIATEIATLLRDYLIEEEGLETVTSHVLRVNTASARVMEKTGFVKKYAGLYEDWGFGELSLTDKFVYKREWAAKSGADEAYESDGTGAGPDTAAESNGQNGIETAAASDRQATSGASSDGQTGNGPLADVSVEQFVMAYEAEQDRIRALLPEGYTSLRPVLRINSEIRDGKVLYLEFNTPVEAFGRRGWLNIANWKSKYDDIRFNVKVIDGSDDGSGDSDEGTDDSAFGAAPKRIVQISAPFIDLEYTGTGTMGGCPAESDNEGCFYIGNDLEFRPAEKITEKKEFCDCSFKWKFHAGDACGVSQGKTLPALYEEPQTEYEKRSLTAEDAAAIPCRQVLGAYIVRFDRKRQ